MKKIILYISCLIGIVVIGCDSDDDTSSVQPTADFDFTINGGEVTFINKSNDATVYAWEFGGITNAVSTEENPTNTYLKAGTYDVEVTLYAGDGRTGVNNHITKAVSLVDVPPTIIIDGDFDDWSDIPFIENVLGDGSLQRIKTDASGDYINIYLEGTNAMDFTIPQFWIDVDFYSSTGYVNNDWYAEDGSGFEVLNEGSGFYNFSGLDGTDQWSWDWQVFPDDYMFKSDVESISTDAKAIEFSINKKQLERLTSKLSDQGIKIIIRDINGSWGTVGQMPPLYTSSKAIAIEF